MTKTKEKYLIILSDKIARDIISAGDGKTPCHRIKFMCGYYPGREIGNGGLCESDLSKLILSSLKANLN